MALTINVESKQRIRSPIDLDFFGERYKTKNGIYTFTSPSLWTIEKNYYYLLANSVEVALELKYTRKPYLLSYNQYGTVILEQLIMIMNGVYCSEEFDIPFVILPTMDSIIQICEDKFSKKENIDSLTAVEW